MCHLHKSDEQSMPLNDVTNRFGVHAINLRTQNSTLWDSKAKLLISGYSIFNNYTLYPTGEIRPEPIKCIARKYIEKLLNVENDWDCEVDCPEVMGPHCLISEEEVAAAIKGLKLEKQLVLLVW